MKLAVFAVAALLALSGCAAHMHQVGKGAGPVPRESVSKKQVYVLDWIPINEVDTREITMGHDHYVIVTERKVTDSIIAAMTLGIITTRTVTVSFPQRGKFPADR